MTLAEKLKEWQRCNTERLRLGREAESFKKRCDQLEAEFEAELIASEKSSIIRGGFTLCWVPSKSNVSWADEFLKECGPEKVSALKNAAAAIEKKSLSIVAPM